MTATRRSEATIQPRLFEPGLGTEWRSRRHNEQRRRENRPFEPPIVAAVDVSTARTTAETAARLARELGAPLTFVHVRRRPLSLLGVPPYERRLTRDFFRARQALDVALAVAADAGVTAQGEIIEGDAADRIVEFARNREARLLVVGSRRRRLGRSISREAIRASDLPVLVAA